MLAPGAIDERPQLACRPSGMIRVRKCADLAVPSALLGLVSGVLSCAMSQSRILWSGDRTLDHVVWPGLVFAVVVLLPISRRAGDGWLRTAVALIASSAVYPLAWRLAAVSVIGQSAAFMVAAYAFSGFLGSLVLASAFLFGRPRWLRSALATVVAGTVTGGFMGAHLLLAMSGVASPLSASDGLGAFVVIWQTVVGASLGRGVPARLNPSEALATGCLNCPDGLRWHSGTEGNASS